MVVVWWRWCGCGVVEVETASSYKVTWKTFDGIV